MSLFFIPTILVFAFVALIAFVILRGLVQGNSGGTSARPSVKVTVQLGDDGFWITSCPAEPLSIIHYFYWAGGVRHAAHVAFQPDNDGRQFVYTGKRPEQVSIVRIEEQPDDDSPILLPPTIGVASTFFSSDSPSEPASPPPPSSSSFPSAY